MWSVEWSGVINLNQNQDYDYSHNNNNQHWDIKQEGGKFDNHRSSLFLTEKQKLWMLWCWSRQVCEFSGETLSDSFPRKITTTNIYLNKSVYSMLSWEWDYLASTMQDLCVSQSTSWSKSGQAQWGQANFESEATLEMIFVIVPGLTVWVTEWGVRSWLQHGNDTAGPG